MCELPSGNTRRNTEVGKLRCFALLPTYALQ